MTLEKLSLFNTRRELFLFLLVSLFILFYSLLIEFNNYKNLTKFDSNLVNATILKQYQKTKTTKKGKTKTYQILKLKSENEFTFYTSISSKFPDSKGKEVELEVWAGEISFYEYMTGFYAYSKIISVDSNTTLKQKLNIHISDKHTNKDVNVEFLL